MTERSKGTPPGMIHFHTTWIGIAVIGVGTAAVYLVDGPIGGFGFFSVLFGWFARSLFSGWLFPLKELDNGQ